MDYLEQRKLLFLGAISATSAFVVTILIVLLCVGCQRKPKRKHVQTSEGNYSMKMDVLRKSKLNAMSKSDTRLHEMHRLPCNANGARKNRTASMDLLLMHSQCSVSDLHSLSAAHRLSHTPTGPEGKEREHANFEDDGLYECVGVQGAMSPALLKNLSPSPVTTEDKKEGGGEKEVGDKVLNKAGQEDLPEYASIRKVRKLERQQREEVSEQENTSEPCTGNVYKKTSEPFHCPNLPKRAVFMGNGAQYIWKPPEESDSLARGASLENDCSHASTTEISEMYSTVCKTSKKQHQESTLQQINGQTCPITELEEGLGESASWPQDEHCYEAVGEKTWTKTLDSDPAYATVDPQWKKERPRNKMLKSKKKVSGYFPGQERDMTCENFYETIGDVKQVNNSTSATTVVTLDDGMEMYVTGL